MAANRDSEAILDTADAQQIQSAIQSVTLDQFRGQLLMIPNVVRGDDFRGCLDYLCSEREAADSRCN